jgi:hypothetical protein
VGVPSRESFLCVVISDGRTFVFDRSGGETRQLGLFFKRTLGSFGLVNLLMLFAIFSVLKAKQSIQARKEFFK